MKNAQPQMEGKKHFNIVLRTKFSHDGIEQCEREEKFELIIARL
jgi:hypothetical protein